MSPEQTREALHRALEQVEAQLLDLRVHYSLNRELWARIEREAGRPRGEANPLNIGPNERQKAVDDRNSHRLRIWGLGRGLDALRADFAAELAYEGEPSDADARD